MVGLLVRDEVAGKSCRRQKVLMVEVNFDNKKAIDGLS